MKRLYLPIIQEHFKQHRQMLFLTGPRQVGKTTTSLHAKEEWQEGYYFSWDNLEHRTLIVEGPSAIAKEIRLNQIRESSPLIIFDEIHKFSKWKTFLKGFYDTYPNQAQIIVTGSARLDFYKRGGDSLMGRYLRYRFHPFSVAEVAFPHPPQEEIRSQPHPIPDDLYESLRTFGGFPDPFLKKSVQFSNQWHELRSSQLFKEDLRDLTRIQELGQIELLAEILRYQIGQLTSYESLAKKVRVSSNTIRQWMETLKGFYYCFEVRPWSKNVSHSLLKEPKFYFWDWSLCKDEGARSENFVASHLHKAVHFWTDYGFGEFGLFYLRDKQKREVDFIVTKNNLPFFLVEVKNSHNKGVSSNLEYFQHKVKAPYAFQVVLDLPFVNKNCFSEKTPLIVPARTFLSQLV